MISCDRLAFGYSRKNSVLRSLDVSFGPGRTILLGPNGAGKSTTLKLLCGKLIPRAGEIRISSSAQGPKELARLVSLMPQDIAPMAGLSVLESVEYAAWLRGLSGSEARAAAERAVALVALTDRSDSRSTKLSGGQLRRLGLACALTRPTGVLLLDEPTAGLDPAQRRRFASLLTSLPADMTVVVSTHLVDDLEESYDRVCVLVEGKLLWQGTPAEFLALAPEGSSHPAEDAYMALVGEES